MKIFGYLYELLTLLQKIIDFLRDDRSIVETASDFVVCVKKFESLLAKGWGDEFGERWYLHILLSHMEEMLKPLPDQSLLFASCSAQERLNGSHSKRYLNTGQKHQSSKLLLQNDARAYVLQIQNVPLKRKKYTPRKKKTERGGAGSKTTQSMDDSTRKLMKKKKKKKEFEILHPKRATLPQFPKKVLPNPPLLNAKKTNHLPLSLKEVLLNPPPPFCPKREVVQNPPPPQLPQKEVLVLPNPPSLHLKRITNNLPLSPKEEVLVLPNPPPLLPKKRTIP